MRERVCDRDRQSGSQKETECVCEREGERERDRVHGRDCVEQSSAEAHALVRGHEEVVQRAPQLAALLGGLGFIGVPRSKERPPS